MLPKHAGEQLISVTYNISRDTMMFVDFLKHELGHFLGSNIGPTGYKMNHSCEQTNDDRETIIGAVSVG